MNNTLEMQVIINADQSRHKASRVLSESSGLSQAAIKDAMVKGAVWLQRGQRKSRLRRHGKALQVNDRLELNYNQELLAQPVPDPVLIHDEVAYSVWFKPFGLACQGSRWGDFSTIYRWVEQHPDESGFAEPRPVFLVHRLDRATSGIMVLCHSKSIARVFSEMFASRKVDKRYQAIVYGDCSAFPEQLEITDTVEGKSAHTIVSCLKSNQHRSLLNIKLMTGRKHQIRKHLSGIGYPILGDRLYGNRFDCQENLQLQAVTLAFVCPVCNKQREFRISDNFRLVF